MFPTPSFFAVFRTFVRLSNHFNVTDLYRQHDNNSATYGETTDVGEYCPKILPFSRGRDRSEKVFMYSYTCLHVQYMRH